ncbi:MAG: TrmH family RNA methyltransferase, partial [Muribaculaceae bacterium]|nr:TrmH family RNA methyltransferase [Muribaculaceae bacterium]
VIDSVALQDFVPEFAAGNAYAFVVGNEVDGVDPAVVDNCDICIEIPQLGTKHSLNVAVSAGITMWHFFETYLKTSSI